MKNIIDDLVARLDPYAKEAWEERAAIMEYDGGLPREDAEAKALLCILHRHPMALSGVTLLRAVRESQTEYVLTTDPEGAYRHLSTAGWTVSEEADLATILNEVCGGMADISPFSASYIEGTSNTEGATHE